MKAASFFVSTVIVALCDVSAAVEASSSSNAAREKAGKTPVVVVLSSGDQVTVRLLDRPNLGARDAIVDDKGELRLAGLSEPIRVVSLTIAEAQALIRNRYEKSGIASPTVIVVITKSAAK